MINMRKKRRVKGGNSKTLLVMVILIPLLGTALGYVISQTVLIPYFTDSQELYSEDGREGTGNGEDDAGGREGAGTTEDDETQPVLAYQRVFEIEGIEVFGIQVGAFSSRENADKAADQLYQQVRSAVVYKDSLYKVFAMFSFDENAVREHLDTFREFYPDAHTAKITRSSIGVSYPETSVDEAEVLSDGLKQCRQAMVDITSSAASGKDTAALMETHRSQLTQFSKQLAGFDPKSPLSGYADQANKLCLGMLQVYSDGGQGSNSAFGHRSPWQASMELVIAYIDFVDRISRMI